MTGSLRIFNWLVFFVALAGLLVACSPSTARLIAVAVKTPVASYPGTGENLTVAAYLQMKVDQMDDAVEKAVWLTAVYGGYHDRPQTWYEADRKVTRLELYVPEGYRFRLLEELYTLGIVQSDDAWREVNHISSENCGRCRGYAHMTLELRQQMDGSPLRTSSTVWHPGYTFERAFRVSMAIFSWLINALIWIIVIIGPFVLIGLATWFVVRRIRR